jgi:hypothetical protein
MRKPAVAGMFYEASRDELIDRIEECFLGRLGPGALPEVRSTRLGHVLGLVCPHAGYVYSGSAAAYSYMELAKDGLPDVVVILGPNHHSMGAAVAVSIDNEWATPLGNISVDIDTAHEIIRRSEFAQADNSAHSQEHSIEVQVPFLQYLISGERRAESRKQRDGKGRELGIVPIGIAYLGERDSLELVKDLGGAIAQSLAGKSAVVIASTDFTHYESHQSAHVKDALAMKHILDLDPDGLIRTVFEKSISMCGVVGTAVMLEACKAMGATNTRRLTYYTSGDVGGDMDHVVGYAAVEVER